MLMEIQKGLESIFGIINLILKENLKEGCGTGTESGKGIKETVINMKVSTKKIKRMGMVFLLGALEILIRETTKMTKEMDMVRCTGLMEAGTRVVGKVGFSTEEVNFLSLEKG